MSLSNPNKQGSVPNPMAVLNGYLWDAMKAMDPELDAYYAGVTPIIPLHDSSGGNLPWGNKPYLVYNRIFKRPTSPFYPIKRDTFFYTLKSDVKSTIEWTGAIQMILDRQDDSAKDINAWNAQKYADGDWDQPVFFHETRIFQIERTDARDYAVDPNQETQFMIDAKYHFTKGIKEYL